MSLKDFILEARTSRGLSQEALAEMIGKQKMWVSRRENGRNKITLRDLTKICEALSIDIPWDLVAIEEEIEEIKLPVRDKKITSRPDISAGGHSGYVSTDSCPEKDLRFVPYVKSKEDIAYLFDLYRGVRKADGWKFKVFASDELENIVSSLKTAFMFVVGKSAQAVSLNEMDEALVDGGIDTISVNGVYLLQLPNSNELVLRRCWKSLKDGLITIGSDDPAYPTETGLHDEQLHVAGRVVLLTRRL